MHGRSACTGCRAAYSCSTWCDDNAVDAFAPEEEEAEDTEEEEEDTEENEATGAPVSAAVYRIAIAAGNAEAEAAGRGREGGDGPLIQLVEEVAEDKEEEEVVGAGAGPEVRVKLSGTAPGGNGRVKHAGGTGTAEWVMVLWMLLGLC